MKIDVAIAEFWRESYGEDTEDDGPWAYQGTTVYDSSITSVSQSDKGEYEVEGEPDEVYVVYSKYSSGDSFSHTEGHMGVIGVVASKEEAKTLVSAAWAHYTSRDMSTPEINGKSYYIPGAHNFFGGIDEIDYELFKVT